MIYPNNVDAKVIYRVSRIPPKHDDYLTIPHLRSPPQSQVPFPPDKPPSAPAARRLTEVPESSPFTTPPTFLVSARRMFTGVPNFNTILAMTGSNAEFSENTIRSFLSSPMRSRCLLSPLHPVSSAPSAVSPSARNMTRHPQHGRSRSGFSPHGISDG